MVAKYTHPLTNYTYVPTHGRPKGLSARIGLGYDRPLLIEATVIYQAELCLRVEGQWVIFDDGFQKIKNEKHLAILEEWYQG